jgi:chitin deacetylase
MTDQGLDVELQGYLSGPRSPGLIVLEHDRTERSVNGFVRVFPTLISQGWIPRSIPDLFNLDWYINSIGEDSIIEHRLVGELNETISALIASASVSEISTTTSNSASATLATSVPTATDLPTQSSASAATISRFATASQQSPDPIHTSVSSIGRSLASSALVFIVSLGASLLFL